MRLRHSSRLLPGVSLAALATLLAAGPLAASPPIGGAFQGTPSSSYGGATIDTSVSGLDTITLNGSSPVTTINWAPNDTASSAAALGQPIDFLPAGNTGNFVVGPFGSGTYTVLNRILPVDPTRSVALNGAVTSSQNVRVWFYSPGGLLIGSTARFNLGGLVLTTADPVTDPTGNYLSQGTDVFSMASPAGSTSAIVIQPGAQLTVPYSGRSSYVVAVAPRIDQGGTISVTGNTALVAAESASFAVDGAGLFNITVDSGTTVTTDTFVHGGSTGGPDSNGSTDAYRRVYMVAVPKNNAISMAIQSGGSIGFDVADAANLQGNTIVLSAGHDIADSGSGSPIVAAQSGTGPADITVGHGTFTSNTIIAASGAADISDGSLASVPDITFASRLTIGARDASVFASVGTIKVAENLVVTADATAYAPAGTAIVGTAGSGTAVKVGGGITVSASLRDGALSYGKAGTARVESLGGTISAVDTIDVSAVANGQSIGQSVQSITTTGGTARVSAAGGGLIDVTNGNILVSTVARSFTSPGTLQSGAINHAIDTHGGITQVVATDPGSIVRASSAIDAIADAYGGTDLLSGNGGLATGGSTIILASAGGLVTVTGSGQGIHASASGTGGDNSGQHIFSPSTPGDGFGGIAEVIADDGKIDVVGPNGLNVYAQGQGGYALGPGNGGNGYGGIATVQTRGSSGQILSDSIGSHQNNENDSIGVRADGFGGYALADPNAGAAFATAGSGTGGTASLSTTDLGQLISSNGGYDVRISAQGAVGGGYGGVARGGTARVQANGGTLDIKNVGLFATASADGGYANGGDAFGGMVDIATANGGTMSVIGSAAFEATATAEGIATGGTIAITNTGSLMQLSIDAELGSMSLDASSYGGYTGQPAQSTPGIVRMASVAGGRTEVGNQTALPDDIRITNAITLYGNSQVELAADHDITVNAKVGGSGANAYLRLRADLPGSGNGTVTLIGSPLQLTGSGSQIDIFYNPTSIGSPTDFSLGVINTPWTAYQLINTYAKLRTVGNFRTQNFALSRNIDASPSIGTPFTPIGNAATPFTGNFDGLGFAISDLNINAPAANDVGFFGSVYSGNSPVQIRNLGLINANIVGASNVGGLIGSIPGCECYNLTVRNSFMTGTIQGSGQVGGLIGAVDGGVNIIGSHSDADITLNGVGFANAGGLVGYAIYTTISQSFANGSITAVNGYNQVGGLVGKIEFNSSITDTYASGSLTVGAGSTNIGGLVGYNDERIDRSYAIGSVTVGTGSSSVGGLVGLNFSDNAYITESYASGAVNAAGSSAVGGFIGTDNGGVGSSYWDSFSTGQSQGAGTGQGFGLTELTSDPAQSAALNYALNLSSYGNFSDLWTTVSGLTRPMGLWEMPAPVPFIGPATVYSAHGVQLLSNGQNGIYQLGHDIDLAGTASGGDVWGLAGFVPIGANANSITAFTGSLFGNGRVLENLTSRQPGYHVSGLFAVLDGSVDAVGLDNIAILAPGNLNGPSGASGAGALAGVNNGTISRSYATGLVGLANGQSVTGGLVGQNNGLIINSYSSASVAPTVGGTALGGLVGQNAGTISFSYANGVLLPGGSSTVALGGLVGLNQNSGLVDHAYWDSQLSTQSRGCGGVACSGATALTTAQTMQSGSFIGWSIDNAGGLPNVWRSYDGDTTPLLKPFLRGVTVLPVAVTQQYNATGIAPTLQFQWGYKSHIYGTPVFTALGVNVGSYDVRYRRGLYSDQRSYDLIASTLDAVVTITPAPLTLSAVSDTRLYNGTTASTAKVLISGLQGPDTIAALTQSFDSRNAGTRTLSVDTTYAINDGNNGGNYKVALNTASGSITAKSLALVPVTDTRAYDGTTASTGTVIVAGLVGTDTISNVTQSFDSANAGARTLGVNANFTINDGNGGANYVPRLNTRPGTITSASLTVTYTANAATSTYGNTPSGLSGTVSAAGLQGSDTLALVLGGTATFTTPATNLSAIGKYAINGSGLSGASANYSYAFVQAAGNANALTIAARPLSVTADAQSRAFGNANPALTFTAQGLVNGDLLTGAQATNAAATSPAGSYPITQGTLAASQNYLLSYTGNTLVVTGGAPTPSVPPGASGAEIETNLASQGAEPSSADQDDQDEAEAAIQHAASPRVLITTVVDADSMTQPVPVDEPVTSNGNVGQ